MALSMLRHYFRIAIRHLQKDRTATIIHVTGLSLSVAFSLLLFCYIQHEQSFDDFHVKKDRLFRLEMTDMFAKMHPAAKDNSIFSFLTKRDEGKYGVIFPLVAAGDMQTSLPEVASTTRFKDYGSNLVKVGNQVFQEKHLLYVDANFLENFSFRLKKGNPRTVLQSIHNVVLSESIAKKYFGEEDPIGKTVTKISDSVQLFTVSGIAEDAPANSSIRYDWIVPLLSDPGYTENMNERFNHMTHMVAVELKPGVDPDRFTAKMNQWVKSYFVEPFVKEAGQYYKDVDFGSYRWQLRPIADCHYNPSQPWGHYTNARNIYQLACLVIVILLIAALNYILLSIAGLAGRSQETGIRKVMGARRPSIILQLWVETQLLVLASVLAGLALTAGLLPLFNSILDTHISLVEIPVTNVMIAVLVISLVLGILAGYYPAWLLSKVKTVSVIKSFQTFRINPRLSKVLVVLQYTSCVVLMMAAFVIQRQMHYILNKDLGFDKEQVVLVRSAVWDGDWNRRVRNQLYAFAATQPSISDWTGMNGSLDGSYNSNAFRLNGERQWLCQLTVDYNYFNMLGLKIIKGRGFSRDFSMDTARSVRACVVNETLFNMLGPKAQLGKYDSSIRGTIIGVVKDYHFETLTKKIAPEQHVLPWQEGNVSTLFFKIRPGQLPQAMAALQKEWRSVTGNYPFDYTFLDQQMAAMYEANVRWQKTIQGSCFFALFIACMGLFGLSAVNASNRTREIGIRKVLGATVRGLVTTLCSQFVVLVGISLLIAIPLSWWLLNKWLEDFAYHIDIQWWMFTLVGVVAIATALVTVSFQSVKAAMANPVDSLRTE